MGTRSVWGHAQYGDTLSMGTRSVWGHAQYGDTLSMGTRSVWGHAQYGDTLTALIRPASVVRRPQLVQHYGDMLTVLIRQQHVQRAISSLTIHIKVLRSALLNPSLAPPAQAPAQAAAAGRGAHRERYRRLCFLNVFTERLDSLLQLVLDVHRSVASAPMVAPLSEFFLDDDAPIWEEVRNSVSLERDTSD
ncbi:unnamed protein product [Closterium sp. Naga37s-1]|nr:unnamed protein product [Closterium sp. Naga37s-1]